MTDIGSARSARLAAGRQMSPPRRFTTKARGVGRVAAALVFPRPKAAPQPAAGGRALPLWPLYVMFGLMPIWWLLGGLYLFWPLFAAVLGILLVSRGRVVLPSGALAWLALIGIMAVSATQLPKVSGFFGFGLRLGFAVSALIVYLYVYNAARSGVSWHRLFRPLCFFWLGMVALGWIGIFAPKFALTTPVEMLMPSSISGERMIKALTHSHATEFSALSSNPYYRTAAPYPYTNNWGTGFDILLPCMVAYLTSIRRGVLRIMLIVSLPLSLLPAFMTLNRGMFVGIGAGLLYLGLRALMRGDVRLIASIGAVGVLAGLATLVIPVDDLISNRVENTDSTSDRFDLYGQTIVAVLKSPVIGYGAPTTVDTTHGVEPLGTQGQMWLVMYSHGIPALLLFLSFFALVAWRLSAAVTPSGKWLSVVPVIAIVITPFYGYFDINLSVMFFAIGLGMAAVDGPINRAPLDAGTRSPQAVL